MEMEASPAGTSVAADAVLTSLLTGGPEAFVGVWKGTDKAGALSPMEFWKYVVPVISHCHLLPYARLWENHLNPSFSLPTFSVSTLKPSLDQPSLHPHRIC